MVLIKFKSSKSTRRETRWDYVGFVPSGCKGQSYEGKGREKRDKVINGGSGNEREGCEKREKR